MQNNANINNTLRPIGELRPEPEDGNAVAALPSTSGTGAAAMQAPSMEGLFSFPPALVLTNILQYLDTSTVTSCRLVSKHWGVISSSLLNKQASLIFDSAEDVEKYCLVLSTPIPGVSLAANSVHFRDSFFKSILRLINNGRGGISTLTSSLHKFSQLAGAQVKELNIRINLDTSIWLASGSAPNEAFAILSQIIFHHFTEVETMELEVNVIARSAVRNREMIADGVEIRGDSRYNLPNLKRLVINRRGWGEVSNRSDLQPFIDLSKTLLHAAGNLETLHWEIGGNISGASELAVVSPWLKSLKLKERLSAEQLSALAGHSFPRLESLSTFIVWTRANDIAVQYFLRHFAEVLTEIYIIANCNSWDENGSAPMNFKFPPGGVSMPKLENLTMNHFQKTLFWENMPNLKKVDFAFVDSHTRRLYSSVLPPDWSVKNFACSDMSLDQLARIYPTLTSPEFPFWFSELSRLSLTLRNIELSVLLPRIFERCNKLKELVVIGEDTVVPDDERRLIRWNRNHALDSSSDDDYSDDDDDVSRFELLDEGIIGISRTSLAVLKRACPCPGAVQALYSEDVLRENRGELPGIINVVRRIQRTLPSIGNLKELEKLEFTGEISNMAVLFGIILCTKLQTLFLKAPKLVKEPAEAILKCGLPNLREIHVVRMR